MASGVNTSSSPSAGGDPRAFLSGCARYVPSRIVTNAELAQALGCDADWIKSTAGIEERRYAAEGETVADLAIAAARPCLAAAGRPTIGMVIMASGTSERRFPGPAASVARGLDLGTIPALDLPMPSSGALFGIALASQLIRQYGEVLVVASEKMSSVILREGTSPKVAVLFGDGAGACVVSSRGGVAEVVDAAIYSDGAFEQALHLDFDSPLSMDGRTIIMQAARKLPQAIEHLLGKHAVPREQVGAFLLHQANQNLTQQVARALGVAEDRFFSNIGKYGNTSSASVLIAMAEWASAVGFAPDVPVVMATFGAGLHWGSLLLRGTKVRTIDAVQ